jgi:hypothetical protein
MLVRKNVRDRSEGQVDPLPPYRRPRPQQRQRGAVVKEWGESSFSQYVSQADLPTKNQLMVMSLDFQGPCSSL